MLRGKKLAVAVGAVTLVIMTSSELRAQSASVVDLGMAGGQVFTPTAFNNNGQVVGRGGNGLAYLWQNGTSTPLAYDPTFPPKPGFGINAANAINDSGLMGGSVNILGTSFGPAALWPSTNSLIEVTQTQEEPPLPPLNVMPEFRAFNSTITAINKSGVAAVAYGGNATIAIGGVIQRTNDHVGLGGDSNVPLSINAGGQIAGQSERSLGFGNLSVATVWDSAGHLQFIDPDLSSHNSSAVSINDHGQFVGYDGQNAALWQADGTLQLITAAGINGKAIGINNRGQVLIDGSPNGIWENGVITPLSALLPANSGWHDLSPQAINNRGQVIGYGFLPGDNTSHGFLLTPAAQPGLIRDSSFASGTLVGWSPSGPGTAQAVAVSHGSGFAAQLTTGSPVDLSQYIDLPSGQSFLNFSYEFQTSMGTLDVFLGGTLLETLTAPPGGGFVDGSVAIPAGLLGTSSDLLDFHFDGPHGSQVLIDSVAISDAPEPTSVAVVALAAVGLLGRRRRV